MPKQCRRHHPARPTISFGSPATGIGRGKDSFGYLATILRRPIKAVSGFTAAGRAMAVSAGPGRRDIGTDRRNRDTRHSRGDWADSRVAWGMSGSPRALG